MFPFAKVHVPQREQEKPRRDPPTKSHSGILGSTDACSYPRHIAACHALLRLPSQAIHHTASARRMVTFSTNAYATCARRSSQDRTLPCYVLQSSILHADLHSLLACAFVRFAESKPTPNRKLFSKEVIRPQVPLRPPCYDFSPVAELGFDGANETLPRPSPTSVKRRAVCARSRDVFTARW
jgi:hypothetical protein